jgi:hypothetical protein
MKYAMLNVEQIQPTTLTPDPVRVERWRRGYVCNAESPVEVINRLGRFVTASDDATANLAAAKLESRTKVLVVMDR